MVGDQAHRAPLAKDPRIRQAHGGAGGPGCWWWDGPPDSSHLPFILLSLLQHFFTSFGARDRCFLLIFRLWQNALLEKVGLGESWTRGLEAGRGKGDHGARDARTRGTPPALPHGQQVQRTCSFSIGHPPLPRGPPRAPVP